MSMNLVVLTGRLTRDPELKYSASGTAYCRFSLAVNRAFQKIKQILLTVLLLEKLLN